MARTIFYGVQKIVPTTDNDFTILYDSNSRPETYNEVRYLVDTSLQVPPAPINFYLPPTSAFGGILPIWVYFVDVSGTSQARPIHIYASGGDLINGVPSVTLNTNSASLCVMVSAQGYWFAPTTGGGIVGLVQSVTGLDTDNTDPLNPVVQISVDGVTITGDGTPANPLVASIPPALVFGSTITGSGTALSPYNAQLLLGSNAIDGTLVVSPLGNDATAVPYDMQRHYSTIEGARAIAKAGDTIVVYAGLYTPTTTLEKDGVNYFFFEGAVVQKAGTLFNITTENVTIGGYGQFVNTLVGVFGQPLVEGNNGYTGRFAMTCRSITDLSLEATFRVRAGTWRINVINDIRSEWRNLILDGTADFQFSAENMIITGTYPVYNLSGASIVRFRSSINFTGKAIINCNTMESLLGNITMIQLNCQAGGYVQINYKKLIQRTTANPTYNIVLTNVNTGYIEINGDMLSNGAGVQTSGIYCVNFNTTSAQYLTYNGNMFMEQGFAIRTSCNTILTYSGNMYGNPVIQVPLFGSPVPPVPAMINISRDGGNNPNLSQVILRNASINCFNVGASGIWKDMMPDGGGILNRDNYLELDNVKLYNNPLVDCVVGTPPIAPSQNTIQVNASQTITQVDVNTTEVGENILQNVRLQSVYPPIV